MIIGFSGYARSGKDTAVQALEPLGFRRAAFADSLKAAAREIFGLSAAQLYGEQKEAVDPFWGLTPRHILQRLGTECLRQNFSDDVWVRSLMRRIGQDDGHWAVADVRFPNEAQAIVKRGGIVVRIERPGTGEMRHESEHALDDWDFDDRIINDGKLDDFEVLVQVLCRSWMVRR